MDRSRARQMLLLPVLLPALLVGLGAPTPVGAAGLSVTPVGVWPLAPQPVVVRGFEAPAGPYAAGHRGADLAAGPGQVVRTALAGRVSFAGQIAGRGVVVVDHGATRTTYEPVAGTVAVGSVVPAGAPIGVVTTALSHCAPRTCLHWGWIAGSTYLDPLRLVGRRPVRLLPAGPVAGEALRSQARGWAWR